MAEKEKQQVKLKGQLKYYLQMPMVMTVLLVLMNIWIYQIDRKAGTLMFILLAVYAGIVVALYVYSKSAVMKDLIEFAAQYGIVQNTLLKELSIAYAILLEDGKVVWMNDCFQESLGVFQQQKLYLSKYIPQLNRGVFPKDVDERTQIEVSYEGREYIAELRRVWAEGFSDTEKLLQMPSEKEYFIAVSLRDVTDMNRYIRQNEEQRLVAGLIYIDNYDEVVASVEEVRQSLLVALVDRRINQYIARIDGIVKKMENDKYFVIFQKKYLEGLEDDRFSLLEDVKSVNIGNRIPATLSIGLGFSETAYAQSNDYARVAIDLALGRGGDQAVIKDRTGTTYYGGKREQTAKNTRVKARVKAEALREFITVKDKIFVMGHKMADMDSFGAAIGIYRAVAALEKTAHIVLDEISTTVRPLYDSFLKDISYPRDFFLKPEEAVDLADENSLVIVVDINRPYMTECPELLKKTETIVVLDHHRQSSDHIENALLSYIEPYASSTCEMVAEVLQYIVDDVNIPSIEASSMYAGITIDTNNFLNKTGVRTFEAAAFLRRSGADITLVRKLLRDDMEAYRAKAAIISGASVYKGMFALAMGEDLSIESPTIAGAQAANELLDINGIKASFVLTEHNGKIYVSARSIDEVNVQYLMEKLGGGGHLNAAGAQFDHTDMEKAMEELKEKIDEYLQEEGDE